MAEQKQEKWLNRSEETMAEQKPGKWLNRSQETMAEQKPGKNDCTEARKKGVLWTPMNHI